MAEITGITKRTIDYYTNLGLLKAERSTSNYRFYTSETIERIRIIEEMKSKGMCLNDIKNSFEKMNTQSEEMDLQNICQHMKALKNEISLLVEQMQQQEQSKKDSIKNKVSSESVALMQSLLLLIT
ncbi:MerR family transcriptional regulator [Ureibacillus aquaedulcis]|uniref:MerR family transcriptional regulator n=1 Tax=Ureibacillus aquaedulcis TaxID=3058421 RepID=A0ABT8GQ36_9BACL|nr:MerR family transcriptional regulator [Ureibacillus sp. BA0131]MDN4493459.1 MerR family transcriptional regulator [Ureibacillus sp. BA0131]